MIDLTLAFLLSALGGAADEPQAKPAPPSTPAQDPDRPAISTAELKGLRDNNIFAPRSAAKRPPKRDYSGVRTPPPPVKPKAPVVTAIYFDSASRAFQVIVEDKNDASRRYFKDPKFMKAGDEWNGIKIDSITQDKAVFSRDGASRDVRIGESIADIEGKPLSAVTGDEEGFEDGETPVPAEAAATTTPSTSPSTTPSKKSFRSRSESKSDSSGDSKTMTPENQSRTLEEMKRRVKKNRPSDDQ